MCIIVYVYIGLSSPDSGIQLISYGHYHTSALQSCSGSQLTVGFQEMTARIVWQRLVARHPSHQAHPHTRRQRDPAPLQAEDRVEDSRWGLQPNPRCHQPPPETRPDHNLQAADRPLWATSPPEAHWRRCLSLLRLQDNRTNSSPRTAGLSPVGSAEKTDVTGGGVYHHQAVGNGGNSAPHRPVSDITRSQSLIRLVVQRTRKTPTLYKV